MKSKNLPYTLSLLQPNDYTGIVISVMPKGMSKDDYIYKCWFKDTAACNAVIKSEQFKKLWPKEECDFYKERIK